MSATHVQGLDALKRRLEALPREAIRKRGSAIRKSLRKAGDVVLAQAKINALAIGPDPTTNESTGRLARSLVLGNVKNRRRGTIHLRVRVRKGAAYPDGTRVGLVAGVIEYGSERVRARGFMRSAWEGKKGEAESTFFREMSAEIGKLEQALQRIR